MVRPLKKTFFLFLSSLSVDTAYFIIIWYYIILFNSFFGGSGFHNPNYLEIKKDLISKFHATMIQNILIWNFQTSWSSCSSCTSISYKLFTENRIELKQELQEVWKFLIKIFWSKELWEKNLFKMLVEEKYFLSSFMLPFTLYSHISFLALRRRILSPYLSIYLSIYLCSPEVYSKAWAWVSAFVSGGISALGAVNSN